MQTLGFDFIKEKTFDKKQNFEVTISYLKYLSHINFPSMEDTVLSKSF